MTGMELKALRVLTDPSVAGIENDVGCQSHSKHEKDCLQEIADFTVADTRPLVNAFPWAQLIYSLSY